MAGGQGIGRARSVAGELPVATRAVLGAGRGVGGVLGNAGGELRAIAEGLRTPAGAVDVLAGLTPLGTPVQVGTQLARDPNAGLGSAMARTAMPLDLVEQSPGWSSAVSNAVGQLADLLTASRELGTPGGWQNVSRRSRERLGKMVGGIGKGFYENPVGSTLAMVAPMLANAPTMQRISKNNDVIVYHGTPRRKAKATDLDSGHAVETKNSLFFTDNPDVAGLFMHPREYGEVLFDEPAGSMFKADVEFKNPLVIDGDEAERFTWDSAYQDKVVELARSSGNDGIIVKGAREGVGEYTEPGTTYVAFGPETYKVLGVKHGKSW